MKTGNLVIDKLAAQLNESHKKYKTLLESNSSGNELKKARDEYMELASIYEYEFRKFSKSLTK